MRDAVGVEFLTSLGRERAVICRHRSPSIGLRHSASAPAAGGQPDRTGRFRQPVALRGCGWRIGRCRSRRRRHWADTRAAPPPTCDGIEYAALPV